MICAMANSRILASFLQKREVASEGTDEGTNDEINQSN
jgi:hypothetical protein